MKSVIDEIFKLRDNRPGDIDNSNTNRYSIIIKENDGSKTAYYFSSPIYNVETRKLINMSFNSNDDYACLIGSDAYITISKDIYMENAKGNCRVGINTEDKIVYDKEIVFKNDHIFPATNGIMCKMKLDGNKTISFDIELDKPFMYIQHNKKYFSVMQFKFTPFLTISCIGAADNNEKIVAPAEIMYQCVNDKKYTITIASLSSQVSYLMFEINLYEKKLFYDTTVESTNPGVNNVFGGTAFLGTTEYFGEQWLYSKPDTTKFTDIAGKRINRFMMHLYEFNKSNVVLNAYKLSNRFCSFGSNWENKIPVNDIISDSLNTSDYQSIDITNLLVSPLSKNLIRSEGLMLKTISKYKTFSMVTTSDSCYSPQIFEVNFLEN